MPSGWVLAGLLTRKIKLRCTKSTVLGTVHLLNSKDQDPDQTVGSGSNSRIRIRVKLKSRIRIRIKVKSMIRIRLKWSGSATLVDRCKNKKRNVKVKFKNDERQSVHLQIQRIGTVDKITVCENGSTKI
jgi:hypothetical protein